MDKRTCGSRENPMQLPLPVGLWQEKLPSYTYGHFRYVTVASVGQCLWKALEYKVYLATGCCVGYANGEGRLPWGWLASY